MKRTQNEPIVSRERAIQSVVESKTARKRFRNSPKTIRTPTFDLMDSLFDIIQLRFRSSLVN